MPIFDTVPRALYDDAIKRAERAEKQYDTLFAAYEKLRPTHTPVAPLRVTLPQPDSGEQALRAAEQAVNDPRIRGIAENLLRQAAVAGRPMSEAAALREAKRLNDIAVGRTAAPSSVP